MIKHCHNCSKCCEVIMLDNISPKTLLEKLERGLPKIYTEILKPITREEAFKRNPFAVSGREKLLRQFGRASDEVFFYSCPKSIDGKCTIYEERPSMCSVYPFRDSELVPEGAIQSHAWLSKRQYTQRESAYSEACTYVPNLIHVKNI